MQNCLNQKFSHPTYQNTNRSDEVMTNGVYRCFKVIQDWWGRIIVAQIEGKP